MCWDAARKSWVTVSSRTFLTSLGRSHAPTQRTPKRVALRKKIALLYIEQSDGLVSFRLNRQCRPQLVLGEFSIQEKGFFDTRYRDTCISSFLLLHVISFGGTWIMSQCLTSTGATSPTTPRRTRIVIVLLWRVHMVFRVRAKGVHTLVHA